MSQTNEDIQFLINLQKELKHQSEYDNDCQAAPRFWTVGDFKMSPANEDYDTIDHVSHFHNDGDYVEFNTVEELKEFLEDYIYSEDDDSEEMIELREALDDEHTEFDSLWDFVIDSHNSDGYFDSVPVKKEHIIKQNTMFLTKAEAKLHIELNHYHYTSEAHTYAMTAWRAPQVERLWNILENFDWSKIETK